MNARDVIVSDGDGKTHPAQLLVCEECDEASFMLFIVNGHSHIQCCCCGVSYCDQEGEGCGAATPTNIKRFAS